MRMWLSLRGSSGRVGGGIGFGLLAANASVADPTLPAWSIARTTRVCGPFANSVVSSVHSAGAVGNAASSWPSSRNSTRRAEPAGSAAARKVTSPANVLPGCEAVTVTAGPVARSAGRTSRLSNPTAPAASRDRPNPTNPTASGEESVASRAGCGMPCQSPSGLSHCPVSGRKITAWSWPPSTVSVSRTHFALK